MRVVHLRGYNFTISSISYKFPHYKMLTKIILPKLLVIFCISIILMATWVAYGSYRGLQNRLDGAITAGSYALALSSMRELVFLTEGMENENIKKDCFAYKRVLEVMRDVDYCLSDKFASCKNYAEELAPKLYLNTYKNIKSTIDDFKYCAH